MGTNAISRWTEDRPREAFQLALLGATDRQIANVMGCNVQTIDYWKRTKEVFRDALKRGKMQADAKVAEAFFKRATGYTYQEEKALINKKGEVVTTTITRHVPCDPWSAHKWLSCRQRETWTDVQRTEIMQTNVNITKIDLTGFSTEELKVIKGLGLKQLTESIGDS